MDENQGGTPNPLNPGMGESSGSTDLVSKFVSQMDNNSKEVSEQMTDAKATAEPVEPTNEPSESAEPAKPATKPTKSEAPVASKPRPRVSRPRPRAGQRPGMDVRPVAAPPVNNTPPVVTQPVAQPAANPVAQSDAGLSPMNSLNPITQAPQAAVSEVVPNKKKKKKRALMIGSIVAICMAVCCGVVAAVMLISQQSADRVSMAVQKLLNGEYSNVAVNGTIEANSSDNDALFSKIKIDLDAKIADGTAANATTAKVTLSPRGSREEISAELSEVYAKGGDLYIKADGVADAVQSFLEVQSFTNPNEIEDCVSEDGEETCTAPADTAVEVIDCESDSEGCVGTTETGVEFLDGFTEVFDLIDGEWIRISGEDFNTITDGIDEGDTLSCSATFVDDLKNSTNSLSMIYQSNPFVTSVSENLPVARKNNPIYQVSVDEEKFAGFITAAQNLPAAQNLSNCLGYDDYQFDTDNLSIDFSALPQIFVEVDDNYNFTRLYSKIEIENTDITVDLDFSYSDNLNIVEPVEYQDIDTILQQSAVEDEDIDAAS